MYYWSYPSISLSHFARDGGDGISDLQSPDSSGKNQSETERQLGLSSSRAEANKKTALDNSNPEGAASTDRDMQKQRTGRKSGAGAVSHPPSAAVASVEVITLHETHTLTAAIDQLSAKIEDKLNRKSTIADTKQGMLHYHPLLSAWSLCCLFHAGQTKNSLEHETGFFFLNLDRILRLTSFLLKKDNNSCCLSCVNR